MKKKVLLAILAKKQFRDSIDIGSSKWSALCSSDADKKLFCRCDHIQVWHIGRKGYCGGVEADLGTAEDLCKCMKFLPRDNLAYLEWKYDQQK